VALHHDTVAPSFMVGDHLRSGALVEVPPDYRSIEPGMYAVYARRSHLTLEVRVLIDFLAEASATNTASSSRP
jgi:DNA-binding transcriptional LysR family regulator